LCRKYRFNASGIGLLADVMEVKEKNYAKKQAEKNYALHGDWTESDEGEVRDPEPQTKVGPDHEAKVPVHGMMVRFFLLFFTEAVLQRMADETTRYARYDWVKKVGNKFVPCREGDVDARKRWKEVWTPIDKWFMLFYLGAKIRAGAVHSPTRRFFWRQDNQTQDRFVASHMTRIAFCQIDQNIHFVDSSTEVRDKSDARFDPLYKIRWLLTHIRDCSQRMFTLGMAVTVDESMIKCKAAACRIAQFMPAKPIKCGIKAFTLACSATGYLYNWHIYTGAREKLKTPEIITEKLLDGTMVDKGHVLYCDNYFTSVRLARSLWDRFKMRMVGVFRLTKKQSGKEGDEFPFHKMPPCIARELPRGWMRRAILQIPGLGTLQAAIWKDKKIVGMLSTAYNGVATAANTVMRWGAGGVRVTFQSFRALTQYATHYNGVDRADRGIAEFTTGHRCRRWYLRMFLWLLDVVLWNIWVIVQFHMTMDPVLARYRNRRLDFQLNMAEAIMEYAMDKAIAEAGGDASKVGWIPKMPGPKRKSTDISIAVEHEWEGRENDGLSREYCQCCYQGARDMVGVKMGTACLRRLCRKTTQRCVDCDKRICEQCDVTWDHLHKRRRTGSKWEPTGAAQDLVAAVTREGARKRKSTSSD